jgi:serine/threonine protein phosphatase PrpC
MVQVECVCIEEELAQWKECRYGCLLDQPLPLVEPEFTKAQNIKWTAMQQRGYKYCPDRVPLHPEIEDGYFPIPSTPIDQHTSIYGDKLFVLADGHSGHSAITYFIPKIASNLLSHLNSRHFDFSSSVDQQKLTQIVRDIFQSADNEFLDSKLEAIRSGDGVDDGCTFIINVISNGWLLNCNVGDSRTIVAQRSLHDWKPIYSSIDHSMLHHKRINEIIQKGGKLVFNGAVLNPNEPRQQKLLAYSRIYRPPTPSIKQSGISYRKTLNVSATMGDVLFKVHPAVMSPLPDIQFFPIPKIDDTTEYLVMMATDGIWDHMHAELPILQSQVICEWISRNLNRSDCDTLISDSTACSIKRTNLDYVCERLVDREGTEIYSLSSRYDDATCILIHIQ